MIITFAVITTRNTRIHESEYEIPTVFRCVVRGICTGRQQNNAAGV